MSTTYSKQTHLVFHPLLEMKLKIKITTPRKKSVPAKRYNFHVENYAAINASLEYIQWMNEFSVCCDVNM